MIRIECDGCGKEEAAPVDGLPPKIIETIIQIGTFEIKRHVCSSCLTELKSRVDPSAWPRPVRERTNTTPRRP